MIGDQPKRGDSSVAAVNKNFQDHNAVVCLQKDYLQQAHQNRIKKLADEHTSKKSQKGDFLFICQTFSSSFLRVNKSR